MLRVCFLHGIVECVFSLEKEETGSDTKVPLERGDSEDYPYDDEEHTDNQGKKQK
jgi:hypothetical protein